MACSVHFQNVEELIREPRRSEKHGFTYVGLGPLWDELYMSMDQVLQWLVPAGDFVPGASRYAAKRDLRIILQSKYFRHRGYANNISYADNLISLVAQIVFDHVECFSPKVLKGLDNYPAEN